MVISLKRLGFPNFKTTETIHCLFQVSMAKNKIENIEINDCKSRRKYFGLIFKLHKKKKRLAPAVDYYYLINIRKNRLSVYIISVFRMVVNAEATAM